MREVGLEKEIAFGNDAFFADACMHCSEAGHQHFRNARTTNALRINKEIPRKLNLTDCGAGACEHGCFLEAYLERRIWSCEERVRPCICAKRPQKAGARGLDIQIPRLTHDVFNAPFLSKCF